jgi:nucleoside-diphosphate-sugar epimerase
LRVLVTGAGGFIGGHVVTSLRERGHDVRALVRRPAPGLEAELVTADLLRDDLTQVVDGVEAVVHLAARVTGSDDERFAGTVVASERLLDALRGSEVQRFVLASTIAVYDWSRANGALDEDTPVLERPYERDGYAVAKVWQERVVRRAAEAQGFELVVLRPGFVWGPGAADAGAAGVRAGPLLVVVAPRARLPLTYVENCAAAFAAAVDAPGAAGATVNVVDSDAVTSWRFAREVGDAPLRVPLPYGAGRALTEAAQAASRRAFRHGGKLPSVLVPERFEARFKPLRHSGEAARRTLGWSPHVPFEEALRRTRGT